MTTISINIPEDMLKALDQLVEDRQYSSRSRAVQDAIQDLLNEFLYECDPEEEMEGVVIITYARDNLKICGELRALEFEFEGAIHESIRHFHHDSQLTFQIILTKGIFQDITSFVSKVKALEGIKSIRFSFVPIRDKAKAIREQVSTDGDPCE